MARLNEADSYHVVVIGGGMVGISTALALQARGQKVAVVDPGVGWLRASYGNAGVISRGIIAPLAGPEVWRKLPRYVRNADQGLRIRYRDSVTLLPWGSRFLSMCNDEARDRTATALNDLMSCSIADHRALARDLDAMHWLRDTGWLRLYQTTSAFRSSEPERRLMAKHGINVQVLDADAISELEPSLPRHFEHANFYPETLTALHPGHLVERAHEVFRARGGRFLATKATHLDQEVDGVMVVTPVGNVHAKNAAVLAAGAYSGVLARSLGYHIPLVAGRGYHAHVPLPTEKRFSRSITNVSSAYGIAPDETGARIGTGIELTQPDSAPDYYQIQRALADFVRLMGLDPTVLQEALTIDKIWMGSRPMTPDGLPVLCRAPHHDRIIFAFGHNHFGFATGPTTGRIVADLVAGDRAQFSLRPFDVARFLR